LREVFGARIQLLAKDPKLWAYWHLALAGHCARKDELVAGVGFRRQYPPHSVSHFGNSGVERGLSPPVTLASPGLATASRLFP
jgi:hypothetical protein